MFSKNSFPINLCSEKCGNENTTFKEFLNKEQCNFKDTKSGCRTFFELNDLGKDLRVHDLNTSEKLDDIFNGARYLKSEDNIKRNILQGRCKGL